MSLINPADSIEEQNAKLQTIAEGAHFQRQSA